MEPASNSTCLVANDKGFDRVNADVLRFFPELVRELGGDPESLIRDIGIDPDTVFNLHSGFGYRSIANLLERAASELDCPDFGMRLAARQGGGSVFGDIGVVMKNSSTLGDAVTYVARHCYAHSLAAQVRLETDHGRHRSFVSHEVLVDGLSNKRQLMEQILLLGHLNAVEITGGQARVREVFFRLQPLASLRTYRHHFGCDVRFDERKDGVVFEERDLRCPTIEPDVKIYKSVTSYIDEHFTHATPPMHTRVRATILELLGREECTAARVAAQLCLHPRTLNRRLTSEGKSFAKVRDQVRADLAASYLRETRLPLQLIADKLGYAEQSVFTRSCSRWFAASPTEIRCRARYNCPNTSSSISPLI